MKGLSFSEPMVLAWLAGRKSVTRRLINPQPGMSHWKPEARLTPKEWRKQVHLGPVHRGYDPEMWCLFNVGDPVNAVPYCGRKPRYVPGETVYIKETWMAATPDDGESFGILYRATLPKPWTDVQWKQSFKPDNRAEKYFNGKDAWRSPRFMPEWAARSHARIVSVRPERIQEITRDEAVREGLIRVPGQIEPDWWRNGVNGGIYLSPVKCFEDLWESLHPGSWEKNEFVWRIEIDLLIWQKGQGPLYEKLQPLFREKMGPIQIGDRIERSANRREYECL